MRRPIKARFRLFKKNLIGKKILESNFVSFGVYKKKNQHQILQK